MNNISNNIKQRLSLREPLCEALDVLVKITDTLSLKKQTNDEGLAEYIKEELSKAKELYPSCVNFERDFPSLAFSIATGIGKTRLMAACIAYLYLKKGIRHFFILAPNLTLYEKLIRDFGDPSYSKYVFKGITEFVHNQPKVITGDNYHHAVTMFSKTEIHINIFNIAKFNTESKEGGKKGPSKMRRLSEYLGQSYFEYLSKLDDLVILMDEAHRYHADASKKAINELRPILGLEMTATPMDEKGKPFKNIVYEYNLAQALADGKYVKDPFIARRKNFEKASLTEKELDILKLEDAISVHENAKLHLEMYARDNDLPIVKPFILVVCKNIQHAKDTVETIENEMFDGKYNGKVLQIDSSTKKDEEVDKLFVSLEDSSNEIEIVVHVNMLKEGWDVTNLYTIVPLRAADAPILVEQSIGRGLRLPYGGKRTGNGEVDKLTVIAHENFEAVLLKAQDKNSVLNKFTYVEIEEDDLVYKDAEIVTPKTAIENKYQAEIDKQETIHQKELAKITHDAKRAIWKVIPTLNTVAKNKEELATPQMQELIIEKTIEEIRKSAKIANPLFAEDEADEKIKEVRNVTNMVIVDYIKNVIEIPRLSIDQPKAKMVFDFFDLDITSGFSLPDLNDEIIRIGLKSNEVESLMAISSGYYKNPVDEIVSQLINFDEIFYDDNAELLYHLAEQAVSAVSFDKKDDNNIAKLIHQYKTAIANNIYKQMKLHSSLVYDEIGQSRVLPFTELLPQNLIKIAGFGYRDYRDVITPISWVSKYIFTGFVKSYYTEYKFDSSTEQNFAFILEQDSVVVRWLRPVPKQFNIYWSGSSARYEPDFVVETDTEIYLIETKAFKDMQNEDVLLKKTAAEEFCRVVSEYTAKNNGKSWRYVLIPHDVVSRTHSFEYVIAKS